MGGLRDCARSCSIGVGLMETLKAETENKEMWGEIEDGVG